MGERGVRGVENFAKFPKVMQTFFTYIDFFTRGRFSCVPARQAERGGGGGIGRLGREMGSLLRIHIQDLFRHICYDRLKLGAIKIIYYFA